MSEIVWELIIDDRNHSVRRMIVSTGWIYQTQNGREYSSVYGTIGREHDRGVPTWGPMIFVPSGNIVP